MNKLFKLASLSLMVAAALAFTGCGDDKKPEPKKPATTQTTQKPATSNVATNIKEVPEDTKPTVGKAGSPKPLSPLYVYNVVGENKVYPFTPEIVAAFEKEAKNFTLGPNKKWLYATNVSNNYVADPQKWLASAGQYTHMWIGVLPKHRTKTYDVGTAHLREEHLGYITITVDSNTKKIKRIESKRIDRTPADGKESKTTVFTKKTF